MIVPDNTLQEYQKAIYKDKDWKPRADERRFIPNSIKLYRDNFLWQKRGEDGKLLMEIQYFDKMHEVLTELGMKEYPAACFLIGLYLEAEKHGDPLKKMTWIYNSYLKESGDDVRNVVDQLIKMTQ